MSDAVKTGYAQEMGQRLEQQDAFGFSDKDDGEFLRHGGVAAVVADGVGGHSHGKGASETAVRVFLRAYQSKRQDEPISGALYRALLEANDAVCEFARDQGEHENCGSTLVAAVLHPPSRALHWIGVGDSRLYLLRGKELAQVTTDGNYASYLLKRTVRPALAGYTPRLDIAPLSLISFLGMKHLTEIDRSIRPFAWQEGDWLVLCTDGIYNTLDAAEMLGCLAAEPQQACDALLLSALDKGLTHQDNATVAILACQPREGQPVPVRQAPPAPPASPAKPPRPRLKPLLWLGVATGALALAAWLVLYAQKPARQPGQTDAVEPPPPIQTPTPPAETPAPPIQTPAPPAETPPPPLAETPAHRKRQAPGFSPRSRPSIPPR